MSRKDNSNESPQKGKNKKLFGIIERGDKILVKTEDRDNQMAVSEIIDGLNKDNSETDLNKKYLSLDDLAKGERLVFAVNRLAFMLERARIGDYVAMMSDTKGFFYKNLLAGIFRGIGIAIGVFLLGALALYVLNMVVGLGIPVIGDFVAELLRYMQEIKNINF